MTSDVASVSYKISSGGIRDGATNHENLRYGNVVSR
jgi:hypothetical protein